MKRFVVILVALTLAAVSPLAAAVDCGGCWGSLLCPTPPPCPANAIHVNGGGAVAIQNAINRARSGAVICVGPGTYGGGNINFNGKAVTLKASPPLSAILHGNGSGPVVTFTTNETSTSVLDGFQITGGVATVGGGILIVNASPIVQNCLIKGNKALNDPHSRGGGAYVGGSFAAPSILCSCFQGNSSGFAGGGLATTYYAHPYLNNDTFAGNTALYGGGYSSAFSGLANIENSVFSGNVADVDGGGLHVQGIFGSTLVRRTVLQNNKASGNGGGMWVPDAFATILNSVFDGNSASNGGGAAVGYGGMLTVESSILVRNATSGTGTLAADPTPPGTTLLNDFNLFFGNTSGSGDYVNTTGNLGILTADPRFGSCYALNSGSPALHTGIPDYHFNNVNGTPNNMGIRGGPVVP